MMRSADTFQQYNHATLIIKPHQYDSGLVNSLVRSIMDKVRNKNIYNNLEKYNPLRIIRNV